MPVGETRRLSLRWKTALDNGGHVCVCLAFTLGAAPPECDYVDSPLHIQTICYGNAFLESREAVFASA